MLSLSVCLVLYCLLASTSEARDGNNTRQTDKQSINCKGGAKYEKFIMALFNKMDSKREVKFTSSGLKLTSPA